MLMLSTIPADGCGDRPRSSAGPPPALQLAHNLANGHYHNRLLGNTRRPAPAAAPTVMCSASQRHGACKSPPPDLLPARRCDSGAAKLASWRFTRVPPQLCLITPSAPSAYGLHAPAPGGGQRTTHRGHAPAAAASDGGRTAAATTVGMMMTSTPKCPPHPSLQATSAARLNGGSTGGGDGGADADEATQEGKKKYACLLSNLNLNDRVTYSNKMLAETPITEER